LSGKLGSDEQASADNSDKGRQTYWGEDHADLH